MVTLDHVENNVLRDIVVVQPTQAEQPKDEVKRGRKPKEEKAE